MTALSPAGRTVLVLVAFLVGLQVVQAEHQLLMALLLLAGLVAAVLGSVGRLGVVGTTLERIPPRAVARTVVVASGAIVSVQLGVRMPEEWPSVVQPVVSIGLLALVVVAAGTVDRRWGTASFAALLVAVGVLITIVVAEGPTVIDVRLFLERGAEHLLHLESPYGGSVPNPYSPVDTREFYGPDAVSGDRILVGFPYLPASLVPALVGHLLGDVRMGTLVCSLLAAVVLRSVCRDETGRILSLLAVASPLTVPVVTGYWVEPAIALLLALGVLGLRERRRGLTVLGTGLLLASKQYLVVALPLLLLVRRRVGLAATAGSVLLAAVLCVPFLLAGPAGFVRDVVTTQLGQPFRSDSISLMVAWGNTVGEPPSWLTGLLPLAVGLAVSTILVRWSPLDEATALALTVGLSLLATVLLSKQAFPNYFYLVQAALVIAAAVWPADGPGRQDVTAPGRREAVAAPDA